MASSARRGTAGAALAAVAALAGASPAAAADATVVVTNPAVFNPSAVTINVGEKVTWRWQNGAFPPHSVTADPGQSESFESGLQTDGFVLTHTFSRAGQFRFYCRVHSSPGGTTQNGVVTVVDPPPTASLVVSAATVPAGTAVTFDGSGSSDAQGPIARFQWDLDGDGVFETDTGTTPTASRAYASGGAVTVRLRATDGGGGTADASAVVTVTGAPPSTPADTLAPRLTAVTPIAVGRTTALAYRLSEEATLGGRLERLLPRARGAPQRVALVRRLAPRRLRAGRGRLALGRLAPGGYRLTVTLRDAAGNRRLQVAPFRVR